MSPQAVDLPTFTLTHPHSDRIMRTGLADPDIAQPDRPPTIDPPLYPEIFSQPPTPDGNISKIDLLVSVDLVLEIDAVGAGVLDDHVSDADSPIHAILKAKSVGIRIPDDEILQDEAVDAVGLEAMPAVSLQWPVPIYDQIIDADVPSSIDIEGMGSRPVGGMIGKLDDRFRAIAD